METSFEQKVREKAYEIWKAAGMAEGMADQHWLTAEQAVRGETGQPVTKAAAAKKPAAPKATPRPAPKSADKPAKTKAAAKPNAKSSIAKH